MIKNKQEREIRLKKIAKLMRHTSQVGPATLL